MRYKSKDYSRRIGCLLIVASVCFTGSILSILLGMS